jgi:hypothetical protein
LLRFAGRTQRAPCKAQVAEEEPLKPPIVPQFLHGTISLTSRFKA